MRRSPLGLLILLFCLVGGAACDSKKTTGELSCCGGASFCDLPDTINCSSYRGRHACTSDMDCNFDGDPPQGWTPMICGIEHVCLPGKYAGELGCEEDRQCLDEKRCAVVTLDGGAGDAATDGSAERTTVTRCAR